MDLGRISGPGTLAHAVGGGGSVNIAVLAIGGVILLGGLILVARRTRPAWIPPAALVVGLVGLLVGLFVDLGSETVDQRAAVRIVEPRNGEEIPAGEAVMLSVALQNGRIAESPTDTAGGHLHLYVDGKLRQMPYSTKAEITLSPGRHEIRVEYVDNRHVSFEPEVDAIVTVTAE